MKVLKYLQYLAHFACFCVLFHQPHHFCCLQLRPLPGRHGDAHQAFRLFFEKGHVAVLKDQRMVVLIHIGRPFLLQESLNIH